LRCENCTEQLIIIIHLKLSEGIAYWNFCPMKYDIKIKIECSPMFWWQKCPIGTWQNFCGGFFEKNWFWTSIILVLNFENFLEMVLWYFFGFGLWKFWFWTFNFFNFGLWNFWFWTLKFLFLDFENFNFGLWIFLILDFEIFDFGLWNFCFWTLKFLILDFEIFVFGLWKFLIFDFEIFDFGLWIFVLLLDFESFGLILDFEFLLL